jgi:hypothetical protein
MSNDAYDQRMQELEAEFAHWWNEEDDSSEHFFSGVSRDVAHEIWRVAYRTGGHRPWTSMTVSQLQVFQKMVAKDHREVLAKFIMDHDLATGHGNTFEDLLKELSWQIKELQQKGESHDN